MELNFILTSIHPFFILAFSCSLEYRSRLKPLPAGIEWRQGDSLDKSQVYCRATEGQTLRYSISLSLSHALIYGQFRAYKSPHTHFWTWYINPPVLLVNPWCSSPQKVSITVGLSMKFYGIVCHRLAHLFLQPFFIISPFVVFHKILI